MPELLVLDTAQDIESLVSYLEDKDIIAFDTETTGVHKGAEIIGLSVCADEDVAFYVLLSYWDPKAEALVYLDTKNATLKLLELLKTKQLVCHNGTFDCAMVENYFKVSLINSLHTDTMILAHLLDENRKVGLKELGASMFGEDVTAEQDAMKASITANGGSMTKTNYELYKADGYLIGQYGAKDALLTYKLFLELVPQLYEQGLDQFFYEDESMPLLKGPTYELNTTGLKVDLAGLAALKKTLEAECLEARDYIYQEIHEKIKTKYPGTKKTDTFNIGSSSQLAWLVFGEYGLEFGTLTDAGKSLCKRLGIKPPYTAIAKRQFIEQIGGLAEEARASRAAAKKPKGRAKGGGKKTQVPEESPNSLESSEQPGESDLSGASGHSASNSVRPGLKAPEASVREPWFYIQANKETLKKHAHKYKWIEKLLEYQKKQKILTTYVEGIEERVTYGTIQPGFLQHGTTSGRYSSRNPNFQNLPRDDKRVKALICARAGKVFVGADYSQLEPRVFAYFSGDERLKAAFKSTEDFYSVIGMEVYGKYDCTPHKDGSPEAFGIKYKKLRDLSKVIALASTYGATAWQLMKTTGKNEEDTQADIDSYFNAFPGVKEMMLASHDQAKKQGFVANLFGRPRRMPEAMRIEKLYGKKDLPYEARNLLNLAVNHRIQSTGASIVNRAAIALHKSLKDAGIDAKLVVQVHDSLVLECKESDAEDVALLLEHAMCNTIELEGVTLEAKPLIGKSLAEV